MRTKYLADLLTILRVLLAFYLIFAGVTGEKNDLKTAVVIVVISWFTDLIDGPLARRDVQNSKSWIGDHDAEADLSTSLGLIVYLSSGGHISVWLGGVLFLMIIFLRASVAIEYLWLPYVTPYAILLYLSFNHAPDFAMLMIGFLIFNMIVHWNRLINDRLPRFFGAFIKLWKSSR